MTPLPHLEAARIRRELGHLQALAARNRIRAAWARLTRGALGFLGGFAALAAGPAAPFGAKLFAAALIGLAVAWPFAALVIVAIGLFVLSLFSESGTHSGDLTDCCACCDWRNKRRERLEALIAEREAWLESRSGPAPIVPRRDGPARRWRL